MGKTFLRIFLWSTSSYCLFLLVFAYATSVYFKKLGQKTLEHEETVVEVPHGSSLRALCSILEEQGIIPKQSEFFWYLRLGRKDSPKMQAGTYLFLGATTFNELAERLLSGHDQAYKVTFKEGETLVDLALRLDAMELIKFEDFQKTMLSDGVKELIPIPTRVSQRSSLMGDVGGIEGYLFPDTYLFTKKESAFSIIQKMYNRLLQVIGKDILQDMEENKTNLHDVLTLASIIEKETGDENERSIISSVYHNRLRAGMRLQADPTVIYGIKNYNGKISKKDLLSKHSYNTYHIKGLPPGPISSVGIQSIKAALWPQKSKYYYFVSKNDGSHVFCENIVCHNAAVKKWQIDFFKRGDRISKRQN